MAKTSKQCVPETSGHRLARLRTEAGYSQRALAANLGVSADQLLGLAETKAPADDRKQIAQLLDTILERHKLERVAS